MRMVKDEFQFIADIRSRFASLRRKDTVVGIGDDSAVLDVGLRDEYLLMASDSVVDGQHFFFNIPDKGLIGRKAIGAVLSDISAMGGYPLWITVDVGVPGYVEDEDLERIFEGMRFLLELFSVEIVGGDTVKSDVLYLSVSCVGKVEKDRLVTRSGARKGDWIWVSGPLGGSIYGRHMLVCPRIPEARYLVINFRPTAMIDISDGLVADLYHILEQSNCTAELIKEKIPLHKDARSFEEALYMGEDFELLFCMDEEDSRRLYASLPNARYKFYPIGKILETGKVGLYLRDGLSVVPLAPKGFKHF